MLITRFIKWVWRKVWGLDTPKLTMNYYAEDSGPVGKITLSEDMIRQLRIKELNTTDPY